MNRTEYLESYKLKRARKEQIALKLRNSGLSCKEVAKLLGISESTLGDYLYPKRHTNKLLRAKEWRVTNRERYLQRTKEWRDNNRERCRQYAKEWWRKNKREELRATVIGSLINGKKFFFYGLNKRPYPKDSICELCGKLSKRLGYHHWDINNPSLGMWICHCCHRAAEGYEKGIIARYLNLKKELEDSTGNAADETANVVSMSIGEY